jgi:hypothetical protein
MAIRTGHAGPEGFIRDESGDTGSIWSEPV